MDGSNKKIIISTTPINDKLSKNHSIPSPDISDNHLLLKKHSNISNSILTGLIHSFKMGADSNRFIVSSEIYERESTLLRTKSVFLDTFGQTNWTLDLTHKDSSSNSFPKEKIIGEKIINILTRLDHINTTMNF